jgi:hypothetical protein
MKETLARLTTNIINPFLTSFIVIVLLAFRGTDSTGEALKWAAIALAFSVLPLLVAVYYLVRLKKLDGFYANPRRQRVGVYLLASAVGAAGYVTLWRLGAPVLLVALFAAGLASIVVFMVINMLWKISLHAAFMTGAAAVLIIVYGGAAAWTVLLIPVVTWARVTLKQHSPAQAGLGAILSAGIVTLIFWGYGLIG